MPGYDEKYQILKERLKGKNVAVIGLGKSNRPLLRFLIEMGCSVTARDRKEKEKLLDLMEEYNSDAIQFRLGQSYLSELEEEVLFLTPGMPKDLPEIQAAVNRGAVIDSEMGLFLFLCQGKTIGITGSVGKTTTTSITGEIFLESQLKSYIGGNIGNPLLSKAVEITKDSYVILELSSFQLEMLTQSTEISVVLNLFPNHLDQHRSMEEYIEAKKNIFRFQKNEDLLIVNADNPITLKMVNEAPGKTFLFSVKREIVESDGIFLKDDSIMFRFNGITEKVCSTKDIRLPGAHNVSNFMVAAAISRLCGIGIAPIVQVAKTFQGIEHRISFVREHRGVKYYNDSKATTPESTITAINAFSDPITLIAGGYDKHISFAHLAAEINRKVNKLILIGVTADQIEREVKELQGEPMHLPTIIRCESLEEAVSEAAKTLPGGVVLLSPACASYDMFSNFEERGRVFTDLVNNLS